MNYLKDANPGDLLEEIKTKSPLVWNISNFVSMDIAANMLLAIGASPAMAHALEEAEDFSNICKAINGALTINIGTFDSHWQSCAINVAKQARSNDVPWVLDPVGAGASKFRSKNALELLKHNPTVLRGNASEIISLSGISTTGKGVDSTSSSNEALDAAKLIASNNKTIVAVTGEIDYITNGSKIYAVHGGNKMMTKITATGCSLTCLIGAALTSEQDKIEATANMMGIYSVACDIALKKAKGPASLRTELIDTLYNLSNNDINKNIRIELV